jgi:pSer/pThr/pTyr-binding forkhead associated (FHA) protein
MSDGHKLGKTLPDGAANVPKYALVHGRRTIPLPEGELLIGRGTDCHVVLDSALVSRRHAKLLVTRDGVVLVDLGSINGVKVDSRAITGSVPLALGARISVADELLEFVRLDDEQRKSITAPELRRAATLDIRLSDQDEETTMARRRLDRFALLSGLVDKALRLGRGSEAEQLLSGTLAEVASDAQAGRVSLDLAEKAARYALLLASATKKAGWIDYIVNVYSSLNRPLPLDIVDELHGLLRRIPGVSRSGFERYVHALAGASLAPTERFAVRRLEGLLRVLISS